MTSAEQPPAGPGIRAGPVAPLVDGASADGSHPYGGPTGQLGLRVPDPACRECRRAAQEVLEGLKGVLLVEVAEGSGAITVTYASSLVGPAEIYLAGQQAGCVGT